jgi:EAL domain-containing protein (putative c-di-GMP-specific phosphodiesterase class I)
MPIDPSNVKPKVLVILDGQPEARFASLLVAAAEMQSEITRVTDPAQMDDALSAVEFDVVITGAGSLGMEGALLLALSKQTHPLASRVMVIDSPEQALAAVNVGNVGHVVMSSDPRDTIEAVMRGAVERARERILREQERKSYRRLVFDDFANLPTRHMAQELAVSWFKEAGFLGVLVIDGSELWLSQREIGRENFAAIESAFTGIIKSLHGRQFRVEDMLTIDEVGSSNFCIFLSQPREERISCADDIQLIADRVQDELSRLVAKLPLPASASSPRISVGRGFVLYNPHVPALHQVRQALASAHHDAKHRLSFDDRVSRRSQLERIILRQEIWSVFQPIVHLRDGHTLGYEALSRGPKQTEFEAPMFLLGIADRTGLTTELDRVFRTTALVNAARLPQNTKIFVNTLPSTVYDPELSVKRLAKLLDHVGIEPSRVVFEFSERYVVSNEAMLMSTLNQYRALGVQLAIDDVGAGYSGLERIASLEPDYLKIDISLVRNINERPVKRTVLAALTRMADDIGAEVIAEGIETQAERDTVRDLGIDWGQGYLIARPAPVEDAIYHAQA